jgi:tRNA (cytosine34-C5)-methyltransferase
LTLIYINLINFQTTFRITAFKGESKRLLEIVKEKLFTDYIAALKDLEEYDEEQLKPKSLCWYPDELAWQLQLTRKDIRRSEKLFRLHNFLIAETKSGNISRQECVSMIPPVSQIFLIT